MSARIHGFSMEGYFLRFDSIHWYHRWCSGPGAKPKYLAGEILRKFQHPLTSYNFSLRGYNGEVLWRSTATEERLFLRFYKVEVLGYMRDSVDQQHEGSPSLVIYSGGSLTWRNLGKRFVVQTLR